jgi:pimeloyl-ACP methyl ester carboxylesterase
MSYQPRSTPSQEHITLRGIRHRLTRWGEPSGSPIVLLHGWLDTGATWQFLVDCLPPSWSFVALDWRGYGGSAWVPGGYWFPDYLADLEALLTHVCPESRARIIGHSMGGNVAALYGGIRPQRLEWLVNLEGMGLSRTDASSAPDRYAQWLDELRTPPPERRYPTAARLAAVLRARNPRLTSDRAEFLAEAWTRPDGDAVVLSHDPRHRLVNPMLYRREEAESCWRRLTAPMLMVVGAESEHRARLGADAGAEHLTDVFAKLTLTVLPGVSHMMHHEDPEAVAVQIVQFVGSLA